MGGASSVEGNLAKETDINTNLKQAGSSLLTQNSYRLIHYHIFKNAGTSVDSALQEFFGSFWTQFEGDHAHDILPAAKVTDFLDCHPEVQALSSHLARPPLPYKDALPIVFLRHPLLRALSVYEFVRKDVTQPFSEELQKMSFSDFLEWALSGAPGGVVIRDYQVIHLSKASFCPDGILMAKATEENYREAEELLESFPAIGIVERFAHSMELFETIFRKYISDLRLTVRHDNKTSLGESLDQLQQNLSGDLLENFQIENALDYRLYEYACQRLELLYLKWVGGR